MPAIKKKWIKASHTDESTKDVQEENSNEEDTADGNKDLTLTTPQPAADKAKKRPHPSVGAGMLRGLDGEMLTEKRKRFIPPAEIKLSDWLDSNLEKRTEETVNLHALYNYYTELCQEDQSDVLDLPKFNRMVKEKFGKSIGLQDNSVYKALIKERKITKEKKKSTLSIKMKDAVHEAINHYGNPWNGVRFFALKQYIGTKYPALQIDVKPKLLKRALEMGLSYGSFDLVKGIGMAGFYKIPGGEQPPAKTNKKKDAQGKGDSADETNEEDIEQKDEAKNGAAKDDKKKKKISATKRPATWSYSKISYSNPDKMEDIFPLAITYQSAPKTSSIPRIRKYIQEKYGETVPDNRWRRAIENGVSSGHWEHISGTGISGKLHLLMDDFDPESEHIEDRICAAIIACHEPKTASGIQIKKYISRYHPDFHIDEKPLNYKKALGRAILKNMIVQLSGLGAGGSFQLVMPFVPTPKVLAGEDESDRESEADFDDEPMYIPRGTKSRGLHKSKERGSSLAQKFSRGDKTVRPPIKKRSQNKTHVELSPRDSNTVSPKGKASKPNRTGRLSAKQGKNRKRGASRTNKKVTNVLQKAKKNENSSESGPIQSPVTPSRQANKTPVQSVQKSKEVTPKKRVSSGGDTPHRKSKAEKKDEDDFDADIEDEPEYTPRKSKSRGGMEEAKSTPSSKRKGRKL